MFISKAPGSIMIMGEHAVLHGYPCIVAAIDQYITATLTPREDSIINIGSALGKHQTTLNHIETQKPLHFVLGTLKHFQSQLPSGCDINITAEFSSTIGFGSSAAVIVSLVNCILQWLGLLPSPLAGEGSGVRGNLIFKHAYQILQTVQGRGSGADIAASTYNAVLNYTQPNTETHQPIIKPITWPKELPIVLVYSGYKTPTAEVINIVDQKAQQDPELYAQLYQAIGQCVEQATQALSQKDTPAIVNAFRHNQQLMDQLGVNDVTLQRIIDQLEQDPGILAAKISGSGLGDCVLGLGTLTQHLDHTLHQIKLTRI